MKEIPLTQGKVALVDDEDFEELSKYKWHYEKIKVRQTGYAERNLPIRPGKRIKIRMHQVIMKTKKGQQVDHKDGDGLNNQKENLRLATSSENHMNRGKQNNNTSGFKGVSWYKASKTWQAQISVKGEHIHLGRYNTKEEAAEIYNKAAKEYHGEFVRI